MGFTTLIKLAFVSFDAFAWPVFALGYPLRASIQAIEGNSNSDTKKLVTYWVIFSLISLFEHAFLGLLQWLPLWPYMKLTIVCWLMIPHFDGAFYVYNHFVHPCVYVDVQTVISWFQKQQQLFVNNNFVGEAYRLLHGPEVLEELSTEESNGSEPSVIMPVPVTENRERTAGNSIPETAQTQAKMKMLAAGSGSEQSAGLVGLPELGPENEKQQQVQKEWSCAVCQVTTSSEKNLNDHIHGRKHKAALEVLLLSKSKPKNHSSKTPKNQQTPKPHVSAAPYTEAKISHHPNISRSVTETGTKPGHSGKKKGEVKNSLPFRCPICNIGCSRSEDLNFHLWGKKHMARIQALSTLPNLASNLSNG